MHDPVAICVAPNGARRTRTDHPAIPLRPDELARTAAECLEAGACMIHVHVRRPDGTHLLDAAAYRAAAAAIHRAVGNRMVVQITSESLGLYTVAEQCSVIRAARPEAASLALRELVPDDGDPSDFADLLSWMKHESVSPQIILYSTDDAVRLAALSRRGAIPWDNIPVLYVLGRYTAGQVSNPTDLLPLLAPEMPRFRRWSLCAFGRHEAACTLAGALLGGDLRVGFENNLLKPDGTMAASNAELVSIVDRGLAVCGLTTATADDIRIR